MAVDHSSHLPDGLFLRVNQLLILGAARTLALGHVGEHCATIAQSELLRSGKRKIAVWSSTGTLGCELERITVVGPRCLQIRLTGHAALHLNGGFRSVQIVGHGLRRKLTPFGLRF